VNRGAALGEALLITLATPTTWLLALAVFLLRGGLLLVLLPILAVPSPVGVGNLLAPLVMTVVFQGISIEVAALVGFAVLATLAWIVVGGLAACTLEAEGIRIVAGEAEPHLQAEAHLRAEALAGVLESEARSADMEAAETAIEARQHRLAARVLIARIVAHLPTGGAAIWGAARLVAVAYRELTTPLDVSTPIVLRVLLGAPEVIVVGGVLWAAGEIVGGLAARRIVLDDATTGAALRGAVRTVARRPLSVVVGFVIPVLALATVMLPSTFAAAGAWTLVRASTDSGGAVVASVAVLLFVTLWLVGLLLIAVTAAWRSAVWSVGRRDRWTGRASGRPAAPG
jgi:hypothetical protein